jgi:hypothetical protein
MRLCPPYGRSSRDRKYAAVSTPQCVTNSIELEGILHRPIRGPAAFVLDQIDRDFGRVPSLVNELGPAAHRSFLLAKSSGSDGRRAKRSSHGIQAKKPSGRMLETAIPQHLDPPPGGRLRR